MITKLTLKKRTSKQIQKGSTEYYIQYDSITSDTTGLGGEWIGSGHFCDLHRCMNHWVGTSSFGFKPMFVVHSIEELENYIEINYSVPLEKESIK